jgi:2-oxoglutarate dehydrogenase E2 component (dihydrolipoamide succinyltransferase)
LLNLRRFQSLTRAIQDFTERARSKRLRVADVHDGTFQTANPGVFGGHLASPIVNQPEMAILAVGTIRQRPVVRDEAIVIRPRV